MRRRVERRRLAVPVEERGRQRTFGLVSRLLQVPADVGGGHIAELAAAQRLLEVQHLEQVELEIAYVALVVTHDD